MGTSHVRMDEPLEEITLQYILPAEIYRSWVEAVTASKRQRWIWIGALLLSGSVLYSIYVDLTETGLAWTTVTTEALLSLYVIGAALYLSQAVSRTARQEYAIDPRFRHKQRLTLNAEGVEVATDISQERARWDAIMGYREDENWISIHYTPRQALLVPLEALTQDQIRSLRAWLSRKTNPLSKHENS